MKATIDEIGNLIVSAETPLEAFALKRWMEGFEPLTQFKGGVPAVIGLTALKIEAEVMP